ncbi:uncharacterized protein LAESUDRAFT_756252 [Laetiporus sulphureus 93-53]|uniref:RA-domain-containing protein n=1 Tax=Laetiporus sulphureus 93-53 TaxID=1314785 RepID=A0A165GA27_9APHY|nr:uncharacterized protein LAESUDRAFT_756252 [Laetiporus sulphureus 93-53]KZT10050.1 hypothetical protein LAESUDRAFT_756252 [Laetiporus sulphureus 93-53]
MSSVDLRTSILDWDEGDVHAWLIKLGLPNYEQQIREHRISGEILCWLDAEGLKEVGIATIGQRLAILKGVYNIKLAQGIPIEPDHYVPPSELEERKEQVNVDKLYELVREQNERLRQLEQDNRHLRDSLHSCLEDVSNIRNSTVLRPQAKTESPVRSHSFKWASWKPVRSPTKPIPPPEIVESPQPSPQRAEHDTNSSGPRSGPPSDRSRSHQTPITTEPPSSAHPNAASSSSLQPPSKPVRQESSDNLKSFKVSLDDPAWKVLPAALKKYKINNDDWQNYAMFICYGSPGNRIERCLSYDEKPLLLFQKLKESKKNPVFMLKHIRDIRSPIAVAQQKQAARRASEASTSAKSLPSSSAQQSQSNASGQDPSKLHHPNGAPPLMTGVPNAQSGWPELMSPAIESKDRVDEQEGGDPAGSSVVREIPPSTGVSYAVAIYPYMAEQEDEFDVVVGDTFIILSRARGWWVVQRDPAGAGLVEPDQAKQGWVPAGCLLETRVPVATAIAEATARSSSPSSPPQSPAGRTPILPLSILSTSFPGIALMDYKKKGEEELNLAKDDYVRVFKRYNHWSYAVKEETGDRGWVPSWYIGKVPSSLGNPQTPSTSGPHGLSAVYGEAEVSTSTQPQVSPMSSAFPPMQTRATTVA